ncbi:MULTISPECIES: hemolysin family protein [unclassified Fusibacter]|uniref:hemolysin family protein n=1 Tax=unclassified Fusibacter TaxID=2624464 RepID=UPI001011A1F4|nr:hemolysin family protein [Fusibacter sp. A1]MCK8058374.1 hemolysin family protein [Fusibacter sp. A2]NPE20957.1 HlyC/CorC family transporter [Fusibacter sp. A1]RXV63159.1 HlyC/CorC family transporter [Fusibacter sp. A1]
MSGRLFILFVLILINGYFAGTEIALISLNETKIKKMADDGNQKAKDLLVLLNRPSRFLATIQIGITLAGFMASAFAAESFSGRIVEMLLHSGLKVSESLLNVVVLITITMILAYFTLVFGELVPKRIAMQKYEPIAFFSIRPLLIIMKVTEPFVKLLTMTTNGVLKLLKIDPNAEDDLGSKEEIRLLVELGKEKGEIQAHESTMIQNVFEFNNKTARDMMTHRVEMCAVSDTTSLKELNRVIIEHKHTRLPVYKESLDHVIGILHVKDLLVPLMSSKQTEFNLAEIIHEVINVPMHMQADRIFSELQQHKSHLAIVLDDYGGTAGLITMEDILEEIMGAIFDEFDQEDDLECIQLSELSFKASGLITLGELSNLLEVDLPTKEYETLNGFLIDMFGKLPKQGSEINYQTLQFKVLELSSKRIEKVLITKIENEISADD